MSRELSSYPFPPAIQTKLFSNGFSTLDDLTSFSVESLSKELQLPEEDGAALLSMIHDQESRARAVVVTSVLDLLQDIEQQQCIVTFAEKLDSMLGGGIPLNKITEICGAPGTGKTQLCLQLAVDVQIPECLGGVAGECVYIDTEGSFMLERSLQIIEAAVLHCQQIADDIQEQNDAVAEFTSDRVLSGLYLFRCVDNVEFLALIDELPEFITKHKKIKLVIVDSVAFHFRNDYKDYSLRTRVLSGLAQNLIHLAATYKLAVVVTNHLTTKIHEDRDLSQLVPALGQSWSYVSSTRVILSNSDAWRTAALVKSSARPNDVVPFQITSGGIRDVVSPDDVTDDLTNQALMTSLVTNTEDWDSSPSVLEDSKHGANSQPAKRVKLDVRT